MPGASALFLAFPSQTKSQLDLLHFMPAIHVHIQYSAILIRTTKHLKFLNFYILKRNVLDFSTLHFCIGDTYAQLALPCRQTHTHTYIYIYMVKNILLCELKITWSRYFWQWDERGSHKSWEKSQRGHGTYFSQKIHLRN